MEVDEVGCELEIVIQDVLFDFDRASIKPVFVPILDKVNKAMVDNARMRIALHGHTDSVGPDNYNIRLSERRGESVMKWLVKKGIAETRLEVVAHGECCPVADNQTWEGRSKNRRVEFKRIR
jgi:OOP family OmpA-OmpF porin